MDVKAPRLGDGIKFEHRRSLKVWLWLLIGFVPVTLLVEKFERICFILFIYIRCISLVFF